MRNSTSDPRDPRIVRPILTASVPVSCITVSDLRRVGRGAARGRMDAVREGWTERDAAVGYSRRAHARLEMAKLEGSRLEGSRRAHAELELAQLGQLGRELAGAFTRPHTGARTQPVLQRAGAQTRGTSSRAGAQARGTSSSRAGTETCAGTEPAGADDGGGEGTVLVRLALRGVERELSRGAERDGGQLHGGERHGGFRQLHGGERHGRERHGR